MQLTDLVKYDKYGNFTITLDGEYFFPLSEVAEAEGYEVDLIAEGWQGRDVDNFDYWQVTGKGSCFMIKGTFYCEQNYDEFVNEFIK